MLSIAVHIRKGNGGGERYDGELSSQQIFDFDRSVVDYIYKYDREPFQFDCGLLNMKLLNKRFMDTSVNYFKFPTEQYYIDQIVKISDDIDHKPIFVLLLTDDISPLELLKRFEKALNKPNIILYYHDNRNKSHAERIAEDLFAMSQCTGLIRSESNFSKIAEIMGDHKFVFFPLEFRWEEKKLIVRKVVAKNYLEFLKIN